MSTLYTIVEDLDYNLSYYKELGLLFYKECKTSINNIETKKNIKKHFLKHKFSLKDKDIKALISKLDLYYLNNIDYSYNLENFKYLFKDLKKPKLAFKCIVNNCNFIIIRKRDIIQHIKLL